MKIEGFRENLQAEKIKANEAFGEKLVGPEITVLSALKVLAHTRTTMQKQSPLTSELEAEISHREDLVWKAQAMTSLLKKGAPRIFEK